MRDSAPDPCGTPRRDPCGTPPPDPYGIPPPRTPRRPRETDAPDRKRPDMTDPAPTRILLADDHALVRRGFASSWTANRI
ncbi:hypothetical protein SHKM778_91760 [Streptomyces sp. KM77-8]|uniref:Response regulator transcription factor n=1 Tax=Streptomyces haneummycinicus TaxID=3074435 RepID=A0AAT9HYK0_9ACTN